VSFRVCVAFGVGASLTVGVLWALAGHACNLLADAFTTSTPGVPLP
jgi:hypothetical protein